MNVSRNGDFFSATNKVRIISFESFSRSFKGLQSEPSLSGGNPFERSMSATFRFSLFCDSETFERKNPNLITKHSLNYLSRLGKIVFVLVRPTDISAQTGLDNKNSGVRGSGIWPKQLNSDAAVGIVRRFRGFNVVCCFFYLFSS